MTKSTILPFEQPSQFSPDPLTYIRTLAQELREGDLTEEQEEIMERTLVPDEWNDLLGKVDSANLGLD